MRHASLGIQREVVEQRAARSLGEAHGAPRLHLEGHGQAGAGDGARLGKLAAQVGAAVERIHDLHGLGHVVHERVRLRRAQARLRGGHLRVLPQVLPRCVDAGQRAGEVRALRLAHARQQSRRMRHRMLLDMLLHLARIEDDARVQEKRLVGAFHRVIVVLHHGQHVAGRSDVGHLEAAEQIHRLKGEVHRRIHLVCQLQILGRLYLVREAPHHGGDRMDAATSHLRAQLVAQRFEAQRLLEQLGIGLSQREHAGHAEEVGCGEHEQMRRMVL